MSPSYKDDTPINRQYFYDLPRDKQYTQKLAALKKKGRGAHMRVGLKEVYVGVDEYQEPYFYIPWEVETRDLRPTDGYSDIADEEEVERWKDQIRRKGTSCVGPLLTFVPDIMGKFEIMSGTARYKALEEMNMLPDRFQVRIVIPSTREGVINDLT